MKKIFAVGLALLAVLMFSGCGKVEDSVDTSQIPQIMMIKVHENYAWGRHQSIMIIDRDGKCHSQSCDGIDEKPPEWINFSEDGWYEKLLGIAENSESEGCLSEKAAGHIQRNVQNFAGWSSLPVKDYGTEMFDYGMVVLYGVYFDADGVPQLAMIAEAGDVPHCRSDAEVVRFVNETGLLDYKFT